MAEVCPRGWTAVAGDVGWGGYRVRLKIQSLVVAVLLSILTVHATAEESSSSTAWPKEWAPQSTAKYPPYPDVWGRVSPAPAGSFMFTDLYDAGGDDPLVTYFWSDPKPNSVGFYRAQEFFSGRTWEPFIRDGEEQVEPFGRMTLPEIATTPFSDGSYLHDDVPYNFPKKKGVEPYLWWRYEPFVRCLVKGFGLVLRDKNNQDIWRRFTVHIREKPKKYTEYRKACSAIPEGEGEMDFSVTMNLRAQFGTYWNDSFFMLKDDTFLAAPKAGYDSPYTAPFAIRFDQNMRSPFLKDRTDLYVIDMVELDPLLDDAYRHMMETHTNPFEYFDRLLIAYLQKRGHRYDH